MRKLLIPLLLIPLTANADYLITSAGCVTSGQQSNYDEIEFGSECGGQLAVEFGRYHDVSNWLKAGIGVELSVLGKDLHGKNPTIEEKASADGNQYYQTSMGLNARLVTTIDFPINAYVAGGFGSGYVKAYGEKDFVSTIKIPPLQHHLKMRSTRMAPTTYRKS